MYPAAKIGKQMDTNQAAAGAAERIAAATFQGNADYGYDSR